MMEEVRDIEQHLVCCVDAYQGIIVRTRNKNQERISIQLPVGGQVMFEINSIYTLIRRLDSGQMYVLSDHLTY